MSASENTGRGGYSALAETAQARLQWPVTSLGREVPSAVALTTQENHMPQAGPGLTRA
jgi:hypothetical protein